MFMLSVLKKKIIPPIPWVFLAGCERTWSCLWKRCPGIFVVSPTIRRLFTVTVWQWTYRKPSQDPFLRLWCVWNTASLSTRRKKVHDLMWNHSSAPFQCKIFQWVLFTHVHITSTAYRENAVFSCTPSSLNFSSCKEKSSTNFYFHLRSNVTAHQRSTFSTRRCELDSSVSPCQVWD